jgi:hypothetical protein
LKTRATATFDRKAQQWCFAQFLGNFRYAFRGIWQKLDVGSHVHVHYVGTNKKGGKVSPPSQPQIYTLSQR